jgi:hypothetical protein
MKTNSNASTILMNIPALIHATVRKIEHHSGDKPDEVATSS